MRRWLMGPVRDPFVAMWALRPGSGRVFRIPDLKAHAPGVRVSGSRARFSPGPGEEWTFDSLVT